MSERALDGVKVVEYCSFVAGPYCTKLLADLGAEVIKIEPPGIGDEARRRSPFRHDIPHPDHSGLFLYLNTNKLGITLNLEQTTGREIFRRLLSEADILVEDRPPGKMAELGLGYDSLKENYPRLIVTSLSPFGQTGPYRDYKAYYLNTFNASGQGFMVRNADVEQYPAPVKPGGYIGEYDSGLMAAIATLNAYYWSMTSGVGQYIDVSKQEAIAALERVTLATFPNQKPDQPVPAMGRPRGGMVGTQQCQDGYIVVAMPEEHQWQAFVELMGNPEWAQDERFKDQFSRAQYADEWNPRVEAWMKTQTKDELFRRGQALGVPIAPVQTAEEIVNSEQLKARDFFVEIEHPVAGSFKYPGVPYIFSETPAAFERPAPQLGEHNELIFSRRLGFSREDLVKLRESSII